MSTSIDQIQKQMASVVLSFCRELPHTLCSPRGTSGLVCQRCRGREGNGGKAGPPSSSGDRNYGHAGDTRWAAAATGPTGKWQQRQWRHRRHRQQWQHRRHRRHRRRGSHHPMATTAVGRRPAGHGQPAAAGAASGGPPPASGGEGRGQPAAAAAAARERLRDRDGGSGVDGGGSRAASRLRQRWRRWRRWGGGQQAMAGQPWRRQRRRGGWPPAGGRGGRVDGQGC